MTERFAIGDHVRWNSEVGHVEGVITAVHTRDVEWMGRTRRCSEENPQYEVKSDKTDHHALHKGSALTKI